ncbi:putative glycolipid-binding domain-containing protein [Amorphus sp. 3PC139-8]|uniref:putative glycolipid-binding domain-containing protein n=1 Tax=Amorphus sp. 3PC139-8 TaxID=2735676 RepID=UPI00345DD9D7
MPATMSLPDDWAADQEDRRFRFEHVGPPSSTEILSYDRHGEARQVEGLVSGGTGHNPIGLTFRFLLDTGWTVRLFELRPLGTFEPVRLQSQGSGRWTDGHGLPLDELAGCVDLEFDDTAFSLTPMIRRLGLSAGESVDLDVVSLASDRTIAVRARRRLSCVRPLDAYRYEDPNAGREWSVRVDGDGFVLEIDDRVRRLV